MNNDKSLNDEIMAILVAISSYLEDQEMSYSFNKIKPSISPSKSTRDSISSFNKTLFPPDNELGLGEAAEYKADQPNYPNGCHICEVEIDPETGKIWVVKYTVIDDVGTVINPLLLDGQIHGGVAQGLGQILFEDILYDNNTGQLLTGSFMDYVMPRSDDIPEIIVEVSPAPTDTNPLGIKGAGEAGTIGAMPCVMNAAIDALSPIGIDHLDMPLLLFHQEKV